jgi:hypothetical protein
MYCPGAVAGASEAASDVDNHPVSQSMHVTTGERALVKRICEVLLMAISGS